MLINKNIKTISLIALFSLTSSFTYATTASKQESKQKNSQSCQQLFAQQAFQAALQQCTKEAEKDSSANVILAQMYEKGLGVVLNTNKAESYYLSAVLENNIDAQIAIGKLQNSRNKILQSYLFFSLAADNGSKSALLLKKSAKKQLSAHEIELSQQFLYIIKQAVANNNLERSISMLK